MLNVVILTDYAHPIGGAEKVAIDSAIGLAEAGQRVHLIAAVGPVDPRLAASPVQLHFADVPELSKKSTVQLLGSGLWSAKCAAITKRVLRDLPRGETVVHLHSWQRALTPSTLTACKNSGHPIIVTLHDYGVACPNQGFFDYQRFEICTRRALGASCLSTHCDPRTYGHKLWRAGRTALQHVAAAIPDGIHDVIHVSEFSREILLPYLDASTRWHAIRNPIGAQHAPRVAAEHNRAFLFIGRVTREKGAFLFGEAAERAGVPAIVVGDGPALEEMKERHPTLTYLGRLPSHQIRSAFERARALVFPSIWYETQGMVVQEAKANGVPLLIADRTAAREAVDEGVNGFLFQHMSVEHLASRMQSMAADDALMASMSAAGYAEYWRDPPTLDKHVAGLLGLYESVLRERATRAS